MRLSPKHILLISSASLALSLAAPALAQKTPDLPQPALPDPAESERLDNKRVESRLQREEKALRDLRQIVLKAQAQGNPVTVKEEGPDPQVEALKQRINDLEETLRRQTGQMEEIAHNAQLAAKAAADTAQANQALASRLDRIEQPLLAAGAAALAAQQAQSGPQAAPPPAPPQGQTGGVLGALRGQGPGGQQDIQDNPQDTAGKGGAGDEVAAYRAARKTLDSGDYVGGETALEDYLKQYPTSPRAPEANYWLGRTLALRSMPSDAAGAYARALKGWPQSTWAGDAVVRLASSLVDLKRGADACKALAEFDGRYRAKATPAVRTRAKDVAGQAACS
ncbi:MAG: tetratricopeptide repeat protein [Caulobacteraceae bacterium]